MAGPPAERRGARAGRFAAAVNLSERGQLAGVPEFRELAFADAEVRMDAVGSGWTFRGYASIFDSPYEIQDAYGSYQETVKRSAFDQTLAADADCVLLIGHEGAPLARTKSRTMTLRTDGKGLLTEARLDPSNPRAQELRSMVDRGDMDEMSFSFRDEQPSWNSAYTERSLVSVSLNHGDCSAVAFGANAATKGLVSMRSYQAEVRARYSAAQLAAMLKAGKAFPNPAGDPSYPIGDAADLRLAIHAIGRGSGDHDKIRAYVIKRATALGLKSLIPSNWKADGSLSQSNTAGRLGEVRSPLHALVTGSHSHRHPANKSQGNDRTHVHGHSHSGDANHAHDHDALAQAAADADAATDQGGDPTQTISSSSSLALDDWDYEARLKILRWKALALPDLGPEARRAAEMEVFERRVARRVAEAAALHPAVTGVHAHPHPTYGSYDAGASHSHEHVHEHDSRHQHHDAAAEAAYKAAPNP